MSSAIRRVGRSGVLRDGVVAGVLKDRRASADNVAIDVNRSAAADVRLLGRKR